MMYVTFWLGSRFVKQLHADIFAYLREDPRLDLSILGNISDPFAQTGGYKLRNFEFMMSSRLIATTDVFIVFDEPWALRYFRSDCKILYFSDSSCIPTFNPSTHEMLLSATRVAGNDEIKNLVSQNFNIGSQSFLNELLGYEVFEKCFSFPIQGYGC